MIPGSYGSRGDGLRFRRGVSRLAFDWGKALRAHLPAYCWVLGTAYVRFSAFLRFEPPPSKSILYLGGALEKNSRNFFCQRFYPISNRQIPGRATAVNPGIFPSSRSSISFRRQLLSLIPNLNSNNTQWPTKSLPPGPWPILLSRRSCSTWSSSARTTAS